MKLNKRLATIFVLVGLLVGGLLAGIVLANRPSAATAAPAAPFTEQCVDDDDLEGEFEDEDADEAEDEDCPGDDEDDVGDVGDVGEVEDEEDDADEPEEADEVAPASSGITAEEARAIVEAAYPNATVLEIEFEREGGVDLFEAELDNGLEVMVDASTGEILGTE